MSVIPPKEGSMKVPYAAILGAVVNGQKERITREEAAACLAVIEHLRDSLSNAAREHDALDHVMRVAREGVQPTRRLDWIVKRAERALAGKEPDHDDRPPENSVLKMSKEFGDCRERLREQTERAEAFRAALASIAYQMSDDGFNSESAAVVRATAQGIAERALIKNQRHGADSPASQVSDPSTSASSAHGVTTPADSAPSDVRSEVAQSAPATNAPLTERFKLVPIDPTDEMVDAACRDVGLCDGDAKDEELRQEYRVAYRAMVGDAPEAMRHQMNCLREPAPPPRLLCICSDDIDGGLNPACAIHGTRAACSCPEGGCYPANMAGKYCRLRGKVNEIGSKP